MERSHIQAQGHVVAQQSLKLFYEAHRMNRNTVMSGGTFIEQRTIPSDLTEKNIRLFAREVLPALQSLTDKEYAGLQTEAAE